MDVKSNYLKQFSTALHDYCKKNYLCDVHISIGSQHLTAHSLILSTVSPKLKSVFEKYNLDQNRTFNNSFKLLADGCSISCIEYVLQYIYTGAFEILPAGINSNSNTNSNYTQKKRCKVEESTDWLSYSELMKATQKLGIEDGRFIENMTVAFADCVKKSNIKVNDLPDFLTNEVTLIEDHNYTNTQENLNETLNSANQTTYNNTTLNNIETLNHNTNNINSIVDGFDATDIIHVNVISSNEQLPQLLSTNSASKTQLKSFLTNKKSNIQSKINNATGGDFSSNHSPKSSVDNIIQQVSQKKFVKKSDKSSKFLNKSSAILLPNLTSNKPGGQLKSLLQSTPSDSKKIVQMKDYVVPTPNNSSHFSEVVACLNKLSKNTILKQVAGTSKKRPSEVQLKKSNTFFSKNKQITSPTNSSNVNSSVKVASNDVVANAANNSFVCSICNASFTSNTDLTQHEQREHSNSKRYACDICGKTFSRRYAVCEHKRLHSGERPFQCDRCGKRFTFASDLTKHRRSLHGAVKPYSCVECGKEMSTGREVADHKRLHQGGNTCPICGKTFTRLHNMKEHIRGTHEGCKSFPCPHCDKRFVYSGSLRLHKRLHKLAATTTTAVDQSMASETNADTNFKPSTSVKEVDKSSLSYLNTDEPIRCELCNTVFGRLLDLIIHDKIHHAPSNGGSAKKSQVIPNANNSTAPTSSNVLAHLLTNKSSAGDAVFPHVPASMKTNLPQLLSNNQVGLTDVNYDRSSVDGTSNSSLAFPMYILINSLPQNKLENLTANENVVTNLNVLSPNSQNVVGTSMDTLNELSFSDFINLGN